VTGDGAGHVTEEQDIGLDPGHVIECPNGAGHVTGDEAGVGHLTGGHMTGGGVGAGHMSSQNLYLDNLATGTKGKFQYIFLSDLRIYICLVQEPKARSHQRLLRKALNQRKGAVHSYDL